MSVTDLSLIKEVLIKEENKSPLTGRVFRLAFGETSLFAPSFDLVRATRFLYLCDNVNQIVVVFP